MHIRDAVNESELGTPLEHVHIPAVEAISGGSALVCGVAPEDEIVSSLRRTGPYVALFKASQLGPLEVSYHNLVVAVGVGVG